MKLLTFFTTSILGLNICYLVHIWFASRSVTESQLGDLVDLELLKFNNYLKKFNKNYSGEEFHTRLQIFKDSLAEIARLNALEGATVFGLTKFSDMDPKVFAKTMLTKHVPCSRKNDTCGFKRSHISSNNYNNGNIPPDFDWRKHGCLSPVLDQKLCFACWAISIVGVMECMAIRKNISRERLSVQELLDCTQLSDGCRGGNVRYALDEFCTSKYRVTTEENYPLTLKEKRDNSCILPKSGIRIKEFGYQCKVNETDMLGQIANYGPLVTIINGAALRNYFGGIIHRACVLNDKSLYHAVQIIGYNTTGSPPYYIVKNSYGEDFGENGYFRLAMYKNVCGVGDEVAYVDVQTNPTNQKSKRST